MTSPTLSARIHRPRVVRAIGALVKPRMSGLPNWRIVTWFPVLLGVVFLVLVVLHISGTSSGIHWLILEKGPDPRLLYGTPRSIRSDEYLVQQSWLISQAHHNWPALNPIYPGGVDMTVLNEIPSWDISSIFRPHLWGYLFFGLDAGIAWEWWLPAIEMVAACYIFIVTINPRRPVTAALISVALFFTPFVQWWYGPSTMLPIGWSLFAMAGCVWLFRDGRRWVRFMVAGIVGYFAVTMAMGLYVPYLVPGILVFLFFAVGYLLRARPWARGGLQATLRAVLPYFVAGVASVVVTAIWAFAHVSTFTAIFSTVYPGQRSAPTGDLLSTDPNLVSIAGAPWDASLKVNTAVSALGPNASEASSVILLSLFLLPAIIGFIVLHYRNTRTIDWVLLLSLGVFLLVVAYLVVPGWDGLAHVLQLDRVPAKRFKIVFAVLLPLFAALVIDQVDRLHFRTIAVLGALSGVVALIVMILTWLTIQRLDPTVLVNAATWKIVVAAILLATLLLFVRRAIPVAAAMLLVASFLVGWNVNPLYRGAFDLGDTRTGKQVASVEHAKPGKWVAVGSGEAGAILVQSGVRAFSGVQNYPSREMWKEIDPTSRYEKVWNRLAHIQWEFGSGKPTVTLIQEDLIEVKLDPCSAFAQHNLDYVLADVPAPAHSCLAEHSTTPQGRQTMVVYRIIAPAPPLG